MTIKASYNESTGTLSVTFRGETREFPVKPGRYVTAYNVFSAKFKSGNKLWPVRVSYWPEDNSVLVSEGGFSNRGGAAQLIGWWNAGDENNSVFNGRG